VEPNERFVGWRHMANDMSDTTYVNTDIPNLCTVATWSTWGGSRVRSGYGVAPRTKLNVVPASTKTFAPDADILARTAGLRTLVSAMAPGPPVTATVPRPGVNMEISRRVKPPPAVFVSMTVPCEPGGMDWLPGSTPTLYCVPTGSLLESIGRRTATMTVPVGEVLSAGGFRTGAGGITATGAAGVAGRVGAGAGAPHGILPPAGLLPPAQGGIAGAGAGTAHGMLPPAGLLLQGGAAGAGAGATS
jgi:hypothetical protein